MQENSNGSTGGGSAITNGEPSNNSTGEATGNTGSITLTVEQIPSHNHRPRSSTFIEGGREAGFSSYYEFCSR